MKNSKIWSKTLKTAKMMGITADISDISENTSVEIAGSEKTSQNQPNPTKPGPKIVRNVQKHREIFTNYCEGTSKQILYFVGTKASHS